MSVQSFRKDGSIRFHEEKCLITEDGAGPRRVVRLEPVRPSVKTQNVESRPVEARFGGFARRHAFLRSCGSRQRTCPHFAGTGQNIKNSDIREAGYSDAE